MDISSILSAVKLSNFRSSDIVETTQIVMENCGSTDLSGDINEGEEIVHTHYLNLNVHVTWLSSVFAHSQIGQKAALA